VTKTAASRHCKGVSESEGPDSFVTLYAREFDYVWRTLGRLGVPPADIPDAVHDVFVIVHQRWKDLEPSRTRAWLFGIARRHAANVRRKHRSEPTADVDGPGDVPPHAERDLLWRALARIDDDRRDVLVLHDIEGYTAQEIATILDIPANTVYSRLRLARVDIVAALEALGGAR
jgi:RNA polymerase sigma-70 factor, ECF subfamily